MIAASGERLDRADERHGGIGLALNLKLGPGADVAPSNSFRGGKEISFFASSPSAPIPKITAK
jgi:hypothetical protein